MVSMINITLTSHTLTPSQSSPEITDSLSRPTRRLYRLYFLSNEELTALLCETEAARLQDHIRKCFDGVHALLLDEQDAIYAVSSKEGETISLLKKLPASQARQSIEHWLLQVRLGSAGGGKSLVCSVCLSGGLLNQFEAVCHSVWCDIFPVSPESKIP